MKVLWTATAREVLPPWVSPLLMLNPNASQAQANSNAALIHSISTIYPDVTIDEEHSDQLVVTDHPVEKSAGNAYVQDNAYKLPAEVTMTYGFSPANMPATTTTPTGTLWLDDSGNFSGTASSSTVQTSSDTFLNEIYAKLLKLQSDRALFPVVTTRRTYSNMVLQSITLTTDMNTRNVLMVRLTCREILFATTATAQVATTPAPPAVAASPADQANPQATQPQINQSTQQPAPATTVNRQNWETYIAPVENFPGFGGGASGGAGASGDF